MGSINQKITTDAGQSQREIEKLNKQVVKLREEVKRASEAGKKGQSEHNSIVQQGISQVQSMAASWVSVQGAIRLATSAVDTYKARAEAARNAFRGTADQSANLLRNIASLSDAEQNQVLAARNNIARARGQDPGAVAGVLSDVISAKGNVSLGGALSSANLAFQVAPESPDAARSIAQGILDTARISKSEDPKQNLGLILATAANSRSTSVTDVAQFQLRAINAAVAGGATFQEGAALTTSLGFLGGDPTGRSSSTAAISLIQQLKETGIQGDAIDQIRALQKNPQLRDQFLASASFEKAYATPIAQLLGQDASAGQLLESQLGNLQRADPTALADNLIRKFQTSPEQQAADLSRRLESAGTLGILRNISGGQESVVAGALPTIARQAGLFETPLTAAYASRRLFGDETPLEDLQSTLTSAALRNQSNPLVDQNVLKALIDGIERQTQVLEDIKRGQVSRGGGSHREDRR